MFSVPFIIVFKANRISISETVPLGKPKKATGLLCSYRIVALRFCEYRQFLRRIFFQQFRHKL